ncbi:3897_t:CDS:2 [Cetraspora pellucida]|uniref:3897_t:CDS:1 n=1 Tax=Cetraspora pellucida TaxID=1433469 RepID=A0ACA9K2D3_9GLOM|nr:3897_t:CDS:2 [Cetraspora pellucida]
MIGSKVLFGGEALLGSEALLGGEALLGVKLYWIVKRYWVMKHFLRNSFPKKKKILKTLDTNVGNLLYLYICKLL